MHRIDGPGATAGNQFTSGNPSTGTPATQVTPEWLTAIQEEVANVIANMGIALNKADNTQLLAALKGTRSLTANGYQKLQSGLIIQWGTLSVAASAASGAATLPLAWPTAGLSIQITRSGSAAAAAGDFCAGVMTSTTLTAYPNTTNAAARTFFYLVIGY